MTDFDRFVAWFNQNLKGETIYTTDRSTLKVRFKQFVHIDGMVPNDELVLAMDVESALILANQKASR